MTDRRRLNPFTHAGIELAESLINGNRSHVRNTLFTLTPKAAMLTLLAMIDELENFAEVRGDDIYVVLDDLTSLLEI